MSLPSSLWRSEAEHDPRARTRQAGSLIHYTRAPAMARPQTAQSSTLQQLRMASPTNLTITARG